MLSDHPVVLRTQEQAQRIVNWLRCYDLNTEEETIIIFHWNKSEKNHEPVMVFRKGENIKCTRRKFQVMKKMIM